MRVVRHPSNLTSCFTPHPLLEERQIEKSLIYQHLEECLAQNRCLYICICLMNINSGLINSCSLSECMSVCVLISFLFEKALTAYVLF